jgi:hypothetical protein
METDRKISGRGAHHDRSGVFTVRSAYGMLVTKQQEATALTMRAQQADRIQRLRERMVHAVEGYGSIQDPRALMEAGAPMNPSHCEMNPSHCEMFKLCASQSFGCPPNTLMHV